MKNVCVVCGYDKLEEPQWVGKEPSFEICSCCGFQSGFDDNAASEPQTILQYRKRWLEYGAEWFSPQKKPLDWNLEEQLKNINID